MIPTKGRTVTFRGIESNGSDEHPAMITRAWSTRDTSEGPVAVNLTVFPDMGRPECFSSVLLFHKREDAMAYCAVNLHARVAFWPDRVPDEPRAQAASAGAVLAAA